MKARVFVQQWIEMKREITKQILDRQARGLCVACGEPLDHGAKVVRGCHMRCAQAIYRAINEQKTTDEREIAAGRWLEANNSGRPIASPVTKAIRSGS